MAPAGAPHAVQNCDPALSEAPHFVQKLATSLSLLMLVLLMLVLLAPMQRAQCCAAVEREMVRKCGDA
jgi:hypothetical protein